jgi:hypothetical protein
MSVLGFSSQKALSNKLKITVIIVIFLWCCILSDITFCQYSPPLHTFSYLHFTLPHSISLTNIILPSTCWSIKCPLPAPNSTFISLAQLIYPGMLHALQNSCPATPSARTAHCMAHTTQSHYPAAHFNAYPTTYSLTNLPTLADDHPSNTNASIIARPSTGHVRIP